MRKALFILIVAGSPLIAQGASAAIGDRVRVFAPESGYPKLVGTVVATTPDLLSMKVDGSAGEFNVRRDQIIAIGAATGGSIGALIGWSIRNDVWRPIRARVQ
jgi:hypothetical protein